MMCYLIKESQVICLASPHGKEENRRWNYKVALVTKEGPSARLWFITSSGSGMEIRGTSLLFHRITETVIHLVNVYQIEK